MTKKTLRTWALGDTTFLEAFQRTGRVTWYGNCMVFSGVLGGKNGHDYVKGPWLFAVQRFEILPSWEI